MKIPKSLPLAGIAALALLAAGKSSAVVLLTDNFTVSANSNDLNFDLAAGRQGGSLATPTISYTARFGTDGHQQVGNAATFAGNSASLLLDNGGGGYLNYNFATVASPISIAFDGIVGSNLVNDASNWVGLEIQNTNGAAAFVNSGNFGILFRANGGTQYFNGSTATTGATATNGTPSSTGGQDVTNHFEIVLSDTAGTGSAFAGNGTKVAYYENGVLLGTINANQLTGGYIGFSATSLASVDNLVIQSVPEASSLAVAGLAGGLLLSRRKRN